MKKPEGSNSDSAEMLQVLSSWTDVMIPCSHVGSQVHFQASFALFL